MSYRDPKVYMPDPTALQRGFQQSFQPMLQGIDEALVKKRKEIEEAEQAEAKLISITDLGPYSNVDKRIQDSFQQKITNMVDAKEFVNMSPAEKQQTILKVRDFKSNFQKLAQIIQTDADSLDARHDASLFAFKKALANNPDAIEVAGDGLDIVLKGEGFEIDINSLATLQLKDITEQEESYRDFNDKQKTFFDSFLAKQAEKGNYNTAFDYVREEYAARANRLTKDQLAYIYSNKINKGATDFANTPEQKQAVIDYMTEEFMSTGIMKGLDKLYKPEEDTTDRRTPTQIEYQNELNYFTDNSQESHINKLKSLRTLLSENNLYDYQVEQGVGTIYSYDEDGNKQVERQINLNDKYAVSKVLATIKYGKNSSYASKLISDITKVQVETEPETTGTPDTEMTSEFLPGIGLETAEFQMEGKTYKLDTSLGNEMSVEDVASQLRITNTIPQALKDKGIPVTVDNVQIIRDIARNSRKSISEIVAAIPKPTILNKEVVVKAKPSLPGQQ